MRVRIVRAGLAFEGELGSKRSLGHAQGQFIEGKLFRTPPFRQVSGQALCFPRVETVSQSE